MTIENILDFLTGGVFTTFKDLIINIFQYIIKFGNNFVSILLSPLINSINSILPNIDGINEKLEFVFSFVSPYINFILDFTFISQPILTYLVISIIFRVLIRSNSYIKKLVLQWYEKIVP